MREGSPTTMTSTWEVMGKLAGGWAGPGPEGGPEGAGDAEAAAPFFLLPPAEPC